MGWESVITMSAWAGTGTPYRPALTCTPARCVATGAPQTTLTTWTALFSTAFTAKTGRLNNWPASSRSSRMGFCSIGWPTMLNVLGVQLRLWLWAIVSRPATPGTRFLYPPPKLAMMCGSMQPTRITRSAPATVLLM